MCGVAANRSAPSPVLLRLLAPAGQPAWTVLCEERDLPDDVAEAVIGHPDRSVRRRLARNRHADPVQRGRLVHDHDVLVRASLAGGPRRGPGRIAPLPDDVLELFLMARHEELEGDLLTAHEVREELIMSGQISQSFRRALPEHESAELRVQATQLWLWLTPGQRDALLADHDPAVREAARSRSRILDPEAMEAELPEQDCHRRRELLVNYAVSRAVVEKCLADGRDLWALAANPHTPADAVARLARDPDPSVRERVASRHDLDPALLAELAEDPVGAVRTRALVHPLPRTDVQRAVIEGIIGCTADEIGRLPEWFRRPDPDWQAACSASEHPLLRRVAATYPELPVEQMNRLAVDPDPHVRHLLAYNHPLAPPELLLEAFIAGPRQRPYLLTHPGLPRTGLDALLDHRDPEVRALAAADATLDEPPVVMLSDPDARVRRAAGANPLLPSALIAELLQDPEAAEAAASNPSLPAGRLHELLDLAGIPRSQRPASP